MEKNERYIQQKKEYNSKLSTFQISKDIHLKVKEYCKRNNINIRLFVEDLLSNKIKNF